MFDEYIVPCFDPHQTSFYGTKFGWLLLTFTQASTTILRMYNPFTGETISLPLLRLSMKYTVEAFSISSAPSSSDCTCMVFANSSYRGFVVGTCRVSDKEWSKCEFSGNFDAGMDLAYLKGAFYFVEREGRLANFNVAQRQWNVLINILKFDHGPSRDVASTTHMVESEGEVLLIRQYNEIGEVASFVSRLAFGKKAWVKVKCLGNRALFLGRGTSLSLSLTAKDEEITDKIFTTNFQGVLTVLEIDIHKERPLQKSPSPFSIYII